MAKGGARLGAGRKAGVPNKASGEAKELARAWGPAAIKKAAEMAGLIKDKPGAESESARMMAINTLLDRAYGKATQVIAGEEDGPPLRTVTRIEFVAPTGRDA